MFGNTPTGLNKLNWKVQTRLIAIVVWLVGAFLLHANIGSLLIRELGEDCIKVRELQAGHLFIEMLGQNVYAYWVAVMVSEELDLSKGLIGKLRAHHIGGVTSGAAKIHQTAFSKKNDAVA